MIRPATLDDIDTLVEIGAVMHAESRYRSLTYNPKKVRAMFEAAIDSPEGFVFVAVRDGNVVGMLTARISDHYFSDDQVAFDLHVYVVKEFRGGLSGPRLIAAYTHWAKAMNVKIVEIGDTAGIGKGEPGRLYELLDYKPHGTVYQLEMH